MSGGPAQWLSFGPELVLGLTALSLIVAAAFNTERATPTFAIAALSALAGTAIALFFMPVSEPVVAGSLVYDQFARYAKMLIVLAAFAAVAMAIAHARYQTFARPQYPGLMLLAVVGLLLMVSADDFLTAFLTAELFLVTAYGLVAINRDAERSTEAGLKFFLLGALSSAVLLFGISLVFGFTGALTFGEVRAALIAPPGPSVGAAAGIVLVLAGLAFMMSLVPFHAWTPDVFEGAPTPVAAFLAAAPKVAALALLVRLTAGPFVPAFPQWQLVVGALAAASMLVGALAALTQRNVKRLIAYCTVSQMGFVMLAVIAGGEDGAMGAVVFITIFTAHMVGLFACVLAMRRDDEGMVEEVDDLSGLMRTQPLMGLGLMALLFSLAGLPPLLGFFGGFYVLLAAIKAELFVLVAVAALSSIVMAVAVLRVVKVMMFDTLSDRFEAMAGELRVILAVCAGLAVFFFWIWTPVLDAALAAARSIF